MNRRLALTALVLTCARLAAAQSSFEDSVELAMPELAVSSKTIGQAPARVDLSAQFGDPPRKQGDIGSCHSFTAVALIEAAYFRQYGRHVRLSEADLYVRRIVLPPLSRLISREGALLRPELRYALERGVMPGDFYAEFETRYHAFAKRFFKFLDPKESVVDELLPESATEEANAGREKIRSEIAGFTVGGESFLKFIGAAARSTIKDGPIRCRHRRVAAMIERQLNAGRPVGIGLDRGWAQSPVWRQNSKGANAHYFTIVGYDRAESGLVFHTRNTWSEAEGGSPDISGEDLCEVYGLSWVRAPVDAD